MRFIKLIIAVGVFLCALSTQGKNTKTTVKQVTDSVALTTDVDYIISDATTPFTETGKVNIINADHAVLIIKNFRPSIVISKWLKNHVYIDGKQATNGSNCQVKMYNRGAIIFPYGKTFKPLTCYTEENYEGDSYSNYTEGHDGGFMKTLNSTALNNKIRSFKLKRGYMVTFAVGKGGWGYSRCFIADNEDLEIPVMPNPLKGNISSYRLFKWYNASKAGVHDTSKEANAALGTTSCFDWGQGNSSLLPDVEWVSHHIYEDWPSPSTCGSVDGTCHMKTNNEPGNSADDHPQDVETVLDNWQNLMRTGLRLCSESSHDGSMNHLKTFIEEIDKRGWRCDILDLHCYWDGQFNNIDWYISEYGKGRPVWISEWVWGSSWGGNGAWAAGKTDEATYNGTKPILDKLNANTKIERYFYWNSEASFTKIWRDGKLTKLGEYYATMNVGLGYNAANEYVPKIVYQPTENLKGTYSATASTIKLTWADDNGDMLDSMCVEVKYPGAAEYVQVKNVTLKEKSAKTSNSYTCTLSDITSNGLYYCRIANYPMGSTKPNYTEIMVNIGGQELTDYYLKNETGTFLQAGNKWGTQASLGTTGKNLTITLNGDKAIINSGIDNNGNSFLGQNGYLDAESFLWTFTEVGEDENGKIYNISDGTNLIGAVEGSSVVSLTLTDGSVPEARWRLVSKKQRNNELLTATASSPIEATYLLSNPNFDRFQSIEAWNGDGVRGGEDSNLCMEKYNTTFDVYQSVSGLPKGSYILTCQGFYRNGESTTSKIKNAYLYANDEKVKLMSIAEESGTKPNSMSTASAAFSKNKYTKNQVEFELDGSLRFGVKKENQVDKDWTIFDNFRLFYLGDGTEDIINNISQDANEKSQVFNLQGMPIKTDKLQKGLYIKNGKKVIQK